MRVTSTSCATAPRFFLLDLVFPMKDKEGPMARPDKSAAVAELAEDFRTAQATLLTEYRGLTVAQLKELRRSLGATTKYAVVKNTLTKIAAKQAGVDVPEELLAGPSALAFVKGDPVEAAKSLRDFAKANPLLVIKGGILEGKTLTAKDITKLADLESREVLLSKLAGAMKASMSQAVALFAAPLSKAVRTVDALKPLKSDSAASAEAPAEAEAVQTPDADSTPAAEDTTPAEVTAEAAPEAETSEAPATEQSNEG
jgi:large subunit ribosomal protein L10